LPISYIYWYPLEWKIRGSVMKKVFVTFSVALLMIALDAFFTISPTVTAGETVIVRAVPEDITVKLGQPFSVNITFENMPYGPNDGVIGFQFELNWNSSILRGLSMQEIAFHTATPQTDWGNIWSLGNVVSNGFVAYAYTWKDSSRASSQGYAPLKGNGSWASVTLVSVLPGETDLHLSNLTIGSISFPIDGIGVDGKVSVAKILAGDINQDGTVNSVDAGVLSAAFGSAPHDSNWNPNTDINNDSVVDILDAIILVNNFGRTAP
jgi:hypothetical protein